MFRETYKSLMDDIKPNEDLKQMLLNETKKASSKPPIKVNLYRRIYAVTGFVAAVAATFVAVVVLDSGKVTENNDVIAPISEKIEVTPEREEEIFQINETPSVYQKNMNAPKKVTTKEENAVSDSITPEVSEPTVLNEDSIVYDSTTENIQQEEARAVGGGASASSFMMRSTETEINEWNIEEYKEYLGFDLTDTLKLPQDMKSETNDIVSIIKNIENGQITSDAHSFYYSGDDMRYIKILTSKCDSAPEIFGAEKKMIDNQEWFLFSENENKTAQTVKNNVNITVFSFGLSEKEYENLLISINEIQISPE